MAHIDPADYDTPDVIRQLPVFDGRLADLATFIAAVDAVAQLMQGTPDNVRPFWSLAVRSRIRGVASDRLRLHGEPTAWEAIRECLRQHFGEHRTQRTLYRQLNGLRQTSTVPAFYAEVCTILTALGNKAALDIGDAALRRATIDAHLAEGLNAFLCGLRQPLQSDVVQRKPTTLHDAFEIARRLQDDESPAMPRRIQQQQQQQHHHRRSLHAQLYMLHQTDGASVRVLHDQIVAIVGALNDKCRRDVDDVTVRHAFVEGNWREGLDAFRCGLIEPLRSIVYGRRATSLMAALDIAMEWETSQQRKQ